MFNIEVLHYSVGAWLWMKDSRARLIPVATLASYFYWSIFEESRMFIVDLFFTSRGFIGFFYITGTCIL
jgi:hypothetical protein